MGSMGSRTPPPPSGNGIFPRFSYQPFPEKSIQHTVCNVSRNVEFPFFSILFTGFVVFCSIERGDHP
jgi:hypothetical protein